MQGDLITRLELMYLIRERYPKNKGWTQAAIAKELGCSAAFVGMIMVGSRPPSKKLLKALRVEKVVLYEVKNDQGSDPSNAT